MGKRQQLLVCGGMVCLQDYFTFEYVIAHCSCVVQGIDHCSTPTWTDRRLSSIAVYQTMIQDTEMEIERD